MTFPDTWPEGCPPADADNPDGVLFRIVASNPPTREDFLSFAEEGRFLRSPPKCPCMPYGLSVFPDRADAEWMAHAFPKLGGFLASGYLDKDSGMSKLTPGTRPSHTTWWPEIACDRQGLFDAVEEVS